MHAGDASIEQIGHFEKLLGLDVIVVHRMLKNSVPAHDYLMMTEDAYETAGGFYSVEPEHRVESLDGIGDIRALVFYHDRLAPLLRAVEEVPPAPPLGQLLRWKLKMHGQTIRELLGLVPRATRIPGY
jgi:hypothetical protein